MRVYVSRATRKNPIPNLGKSTPGLLLLVQQQRRDLQLVSALRMMRQSDGCTRLSFFFRLEFGPASPKSGSLDTPLYLYYSLLFSYISILFIFQRERKKEYIRENI